MLLAATVALVLLLAIAQLAMAQQDMAPAQSLNTPQLDTDETQTAGGGEGEGQSTAPDPSGQNEASQTQPAAGAKGNPSDTSSDLLMQLNQNNKLVIDCPAVSDKLSQLKATPANDPQTQAALIGAEVLSQLCADGGFKPSNNAGETNGSSPNGTGSTQPQQQSERTTSSGD
jgi:hypothetical protein